MIKNKAVIAGRRIRFRIHELKNVGKNFVAPQSTVGRMEMKLLKVKPVVQPIGFQATFLIHAMAMNARKLSS
jgi:hypothetical protein